MRTEARTEAKTGRSISVICYGYAYKPIKLHFHMCDYFIHLGVARPYNLILVAVHFSTIQNSDFRK